MKVAFTDALLILQRGMDAYKAKHQKWWKRMDGTPILNDLPVVMAEVVSEELHYPPSAIPSETGDTVKLPEGWLDLARATGETPDAIMRRALINIASTPAYSTLTASPQEVAWAALRAAGALTGTPPIAVRTETGTGRET